MEKEAGLVEDRYCDSTPRPKDRSRTCNTHACPAWWWSGPWQPCSVTCGDNGIRRRTVICVRSFGPTEQMALLDSACDHSGKPHETEPCPTQAPCLQLLEWRVGPWSKVSVCRLLHLRDDSAGADSLCEKAKLWARLNNPSLTLNRIYDKAY